MNTSIRTLVLGATLALLLVGPGFAQTASPAGASQRRAQDAEVDFVDSETAVWNTRSVNDTIFQDGMSVNAVMFEKKQVRDLRQVDFLPKTKVEELEVDKPMTAPTVVKIQGKSVDLGR